MVRVKKLYSGLGAPATTSTDISLRATWVASNVWLLRLETSPSNGAISIRYMCGPG